MFTTANSIVAGWLIALLLPGSLSLPSHERHAAFIGYHEHPATSVQGKWAQVSKEQQYDMIAAGFPTYFPHHLQMWSCSAARMARYATA
jgi:hypothetical protein